MKAKSRKIILYSLPLVAAGLAFLLAWGPLETLEFKSVDLRFRWRGNLEPFPEITIISIDEATLNQITEPLIFWNPHLAAVVKALADGGARVVIVDMLQRQSFHHLLPQHEQSLTQALLLVRDRMPVILASEISPLPEDKGYKITEPIPAFKLFAETGFVNLTLDRDGCIRRQELLARTAPGGSSDLYPSFALMASALYRQQAPKLKGGRLFLGEELIPTDKHHRMYINFTGPEGSYPYFSFGQALSKAQAAEGEYFKKNFGNKIVFLGVGAGEIEEKRITPFYRYKGGIWPMAGVEVHAQSLDTILSRRFLQSPPAWIDLVILVVFALAAVFISQRWRYWRGLLVVFLIGAVYLAAAFYLFGQNYLLPLALPLQALLYATIAANAYQYVLERQDRRVLEASFKAYVNEEVMNQILQNPSLASTHGTREQVTILFSDLRNFTGRTEKKEPEEVVAFLNQYLSAMTDIIMDCGGTLDKFMGDGILCFFGAPLPLPQNGAPHALRAALAMQEKLIALNEHWGYTDAQQRVNMGIGVHTGNVVVGNIGSAKKMDYTIIGDAVNLASRLEGETKKFRYPIIISEEALQNAGDEFKAEFLEPIKVKGRITPVRVYGLGTPREVSTDTVTELII